MKKIVIAPLFLIALSIFVSGQTALTTADYDRAAKMLSFNTNQLVDRAGVRATFLPDGRLWYSVLTAAGREFVVINPADGSRKVSKTRAEAELPAVQPPRPSPNAVPNSSTSPDGKKAVYIKDWNLWVRDLETGADKQLTKDGVKDFGYATDNSGWRKSERPVVLWSPDSKKVVTFQQDQRHVSDMYLVTTNVGAPKLEAWKYPLPQDKDIIKIHRVIIDVDQAFVIRLKIEPDARRGTLCDEINCEGAFDDNEWSADSKNLAFVSTPRDHKAAKLRIADASTGSVRDVYEEKVATQYESGQGAINWRYLPASNEFIWYSEKDDWGHLYLHDLATGAVKNQITKGNFVVTRVLKVDREARVLFFEANGRESGRDPYFSHFYRVDFDGKNLKLLTPEDGHHVIALSPDEKLFVDNYSQPNVPNVSVLRDLTGKKIADLDKTDVTRLAATGWRAPTPVKVKSRDAKWDLYGLIFTPTNLDTKKKYPIVNYIYPGPSGGGVGSRGFAPSRSDHQALAELGFVVVIIDGTCNPERSKSFHDSCYGNMADNTIEDQIAGIKELASTRPYMDTTRVGVWGHSGGGFATGTAMFKYGDFYDVGIAESGNHDNRNYEDDWGERYIGLMVGDNYEKQANQIYAKNLKGKLLLIHGAMDDNVPHYATFLVADELIKANKDFDMIMLPNARHGYAASAVGPPNQQPSLYIMRRRWDYFVRHLLGATPPENYEIKPMNDPRLTAGR